VTGRAAGCVAAVLLCGVARSAAPQGAPVAVVAIGEGRSFSAALSAAVRMAVESGAGATVTGAVSSKGNSLNADSVRAVSRGVVTRYALLDSSRTPGETRVRILAMVSRIAERDAVGARGRHVAAQGDLWTANAALDAARRGDEGRLLAELFSTTDHQPSPYAYEVEAGPPVPSGPRLRLRLRVIRTPAPAYNALRDRAHAILAAVAGPAGVRSTMLPTATTDHVVRACISHCASGERRLLNPRAALDDSDSLGRFDPPVVTATGAAPVQTLFPELPTVGGFAVAFTDSSRKRQTFVHVRSTRGYLAVAGYLRATFDDARFRLEVGNRSVDVFESFRAPATGQPAPRFETTARPAAMEVALAQGFRQWTSGGPGAATSLGSPYVVLSLPAADERRADTAYVDITLSPAEVSGVTELGVAPLGAASDAREVVKARRAPTTASAAPTAAHAAQASKVDEPVVPLAVLDAIARPPLSDGDGAVTLSSTHGPVVAVGTSVVDSTAPTQACAVARLRAQRELIRFITGARLEARIGLSTSETRGTGVEEHFHEEISETVAGRMAGAALAAQWTANAPRRCRVALWLTDGLIIRRDSTERPPR
jgi:hypothetical protein